MSTRGALLRLVSIVAVVGMVAGYGLASAGPVAASSWNPQVTLTLTVASPAGMAVDAAGDVFVANTNSSNVVELPKGGSQTTLAFTGLAQPTGIAVNSAGDLFVADATANKVVELPHGGGQFTLGFTGLSGPYGVALDAAGAVYVTDSGNNRVLKLQGGSQSLVPTLPVLNPTGIAVDGAGTVYVADTGYSRIVTAPVGGIPSQLYLGLNHPRGVAVTPAGDVVVADTGANRIVYQRKDGPAETIPTTLITNPIGIAINSRGDVFTADDRGHAYLIRVLFDADERFVEAAYQDFLHRAPTSLELATLAGSLTAHTTTRAGIVTNLSTSTEWLSALVQKLYQDTLGRPGDAGGVAYWVSRLRAGATVAGVAAAFYASAEYYQGIGGNTPTLWLTDLYHKLLARNPDSGGLAYWQAQIAAGGRTSVALRFYNSAESCHARVRNLYLALLGRTPDPAGADYWAGVVLSKGDLALAANLASSVEYYQRAQTRYA